MILLDAFALIAFLKGEAAADPVEALLRAGVEVSAVNLAEALDVVGRLDGVDAKELRDLVEPLLVGSITLTSITSRHVWRAAEIRRRHYRRKKCPLSLGDSFVLAVAASGGGELATADPDLLRVARAEDITVRELPGEAYSDNRV
jgi:PIN domain nuclease of toxin-antitoxin system